MAWQTTPLGVLVLSVTALLTIGAAARLTRLVIQDTLTQPMRSYLDSKAAEHWYPADESKPDELTHATPAPLAWRWAAKLARCAWCAGFWIAALLGALYFGILLDAWPWTTAVHAYTYITATLATSHAIGLAHDWLDSPAPIRQVQIMPAHLTIRQDNEPTP